LISRSHVGSSPTGQTKFMQIRYDEVKVGDRLLVQSDGQKTKHEALVNEVDSWFCYDAVEKMVKVVVNEGTEIFYGWANRVLEKMD
jgi:hypothetical protein